MLLGIPYHAITLGHNWTTLPSQDDGLAMFLAEIVHSFRMPAFFIVAGYFTGLLLMRKNPGQWFRGRMLRLGVPFLACVLLLSPLQMLIDQVGMIGFSASWEQIKSGWISQVSLPGSHWIRHLWFLPALLWLSLLVALAHAAIPTLKSYRLSPRIEAAINSWPWATMLFLIGGTAVLAVAGRAAVFLTGAASHPVIQMVNFQGAAANLPFFFVGVILPRSASLLALFVKLRPTFVIGAVAASVAYAYLGSSESGVITAIKIGLVCTAGVLWAHVFFSVAYRWFDKPSPTVRRIVDASFVIYLFHQPILTGMKLALLHFGVNPEVGFLVITVVTLVTTYAIFLLVIRFPIANLLFNGVYRR